MKTENEVPQKTVKQWLEQLKEPYKTKAINNTKDNVLNLTAFSLHSALMMAFVFHSSFEGNDYWWDVIGSLTD